MGYKSILTVITDPARADAQIAAATTLATREDAHLDILCVGIDRTQTAYYYGATAILQESNIEAARVDAQALETLVKELLTGAELRWSVQTAVAQLGGLGTAVAIQARFADIVVLDKPYGAGRGIEAEAIIEAALFDAGVPVLVVPEAGLPQTPPGTVVLAWNQSQEALDAARAALPILARARLVNIVVIDPPSHGPERSDPGGRLSQFLARHGVSVEISVLARTMPRISDILARHCTDVHADLLVMGAYGHSRFRESILGGATRNTLEKTGIPLFMAH